MDERVRGRPTGPRAERTGDDRVISGHTLSAREILRNLDDKDLRNACSTSQEMRKICDQPGFWLERLKEYFPHFAATQKIPKYVKPEYVYNTFVLLMESFEIGELQAMKKVARYLSVVDSLTGNPEVFKYLYNHLFPSNDEFFGHFTLNYEHDLPVIETLERWCVIYALKRGSLERALDLDYGHDDLPYLIGYASEETFRKYLNLVVKDERYEHQKEPLVEQSPFLPTSLFRIFMSNEELKKEFLESSELIYTSIVQYHGEFLKSYMTKKMIDRLSYYFINTITSISAQDYRYLQAKSQGIQTVLQFILESKNGFPIKELYSHFKAAFIVPSFEPRFAAYAFYTLASKGIFVEKIDNSTDQDWQMHWAKYCYRFGKLDLLPFEFEERLLPFRD